MTFVGRQWAGLLIAEHGRALILRIDCDGSPNQAKTRPMT
jgi:hypothetical protein